MKERFAQLVDRFAQARARRIEKGLRRSLEVRALVETGGVELWELDQAEYECLLADAAACRAIRKRSELTLVWIGIAVCIGVAVFTYRAGEDAEWARWQDCYVVEREEGHAGVACVRKLHP